MTETRLGVFPFPTKEHDAHTAPTIVGPAETRAVLEQMRQSDRVNLEWWSASYEPLEHLAINYLTANGNVPDWTKLMTDLVKRHSRNYVIVIGPPAKARDAEATKARNAVLASGAIWASAEPGEEEQTRLTLQNEFYEIQELNTFGALEEDSNIKPIPEGSREAIKLNIDSLPVKDASHR